MIIRPPLSALVSVALAVLVLVLAMQLREARAEAELHRRAALLPVPGFAVPTVATQTLDGDPFVLGSTAPDVKQLLFFFTTTCPYCAETMPVWNDLAADMPSNVEVVAVSLDVDSLPLSEWAERWNLRFPVVRLPEPKLAEIFRVPVVPLTILLDHEGRVLHARSGTLAAREAAVDSIRAAAFAPSVSPVPLVAAADSSAP